MSQVLTLRDAVTEYGEHLGLPWFPLHLPGVDGTTGREFNGKQPLAAIAIKIKSNICRFQSLGL